MSMPDHRPSMGELRQRTTWDQVQRHFLSTRAQPRRELLDRFMILLFGRGFTVADRLRVFFTGRSEADGCMTAHDLEWESFRHVYQEGDEVWLFSGDNGPLAKSAGYALVRNGNVIAAITVICS